MPSSPKPNRGRIKPPLEYPPKPKLVFGVHERCPWCKGTGKRLKKKELCGACKGTGVYDKAQGRPPDE